MILRWILVRHCSCLCNASIRTSIHTEIKTYVVHARGGREHPSAVLNLTCNFLKPRTLSERKVFLELQKVMLNTKYLDLNDTQNFRNQHHDKE